MVADPTWATLPVTVDVIEELGSDIHVIFSIESAPVHNTIAADGDPVTPLASGNSLWTARVSSRSRVRPGQRLQLAVDTSNLHFFDPASELAIGHAAAAI